MTPLDLTLDVIASARYGVECDCIVADVRTMHLADPSLPLFRREQVEQAVQTLVAAGRIVERDGSWIKAEKPAEKPVRALQGELF